MGSAPSGCRCHSESNGKRWARWCPEERRPCRAAVTAVGLAIGAGVVLALACSLRASSRFAPSPTALGIAFIAPANYSVTFCIGGLLVGLVHYLRSSEAEQLAPSAGAGAIAGESLVGLITVLLTASGLIR